MCNIHLNIQMLVCGRFTKLPEPACPKTTQNLIVCRGATALHSAPWSFPPTHKRQRGLPICASVFPLSSFYMTYEKQYPISDSWLILFPVQQDDAKAKLLLDSRRLIFVINQTFSRKLQAMLLVKQIYNKMAASYTLWIVCYRKTVQWYDIYLKRETSVI